MFFLLGRDSLPSFRLDQLSSDLSAVLDRSVRVRARELFLVAADDRPESAALERLLALLRAEPFDTEELTSGQLLVVPRPGTVTPWASKAGDILSRCGLEPWSRIEHATLFEIDGAEAAALPEAARQRLHDRMTQVVVDRLDALEGKLLRGGQGAQLGDLSVNPGDHGSDRRVFCVTHQEAVREPPRCHDKKNAQPCYCFLHHSQPIPEPA